MHFLLTVAVIVYAPAGGGAAAKLADRAEAERALVAALRATGAEVFAAADGTVAAAKAAEARGWVARDTLGFFTRAAAHVADGRQALTRVELGRAESELAAAESEYAAELARPGVAAEAATAALWRGVALFELGRRADAERAWRRAVALEPATELTEAMVRPDAARAFAAALKPRPSSHPASAPLTITATVPFSLDGNPHETGGALSVPVGEHLLRADGVVRLVDVPAAGATVRLDAPVDATAAAIAELATRPTIDGIAAARAALGVDAIVVAAVSRDNGALTYAAQRLQSGCATPVVTETRAAELARRLEAAPCAEAQLGILEAPAIAKPRPLQPQPPTVTELATLTRMEPRHGPRPPLHMPVWQRPWLWATVVSALAVGVVVGVTLWPRDPSYSATIGFNQFALRR